MFIDTHTHFYDEWLLPEAEEAVRRALEAGVGKMIQADVDSRERPAMWEIGDRHPGVIYEMLGLYPGSVDANWREELDALEPYKDKGIVAIGEIGLDYHEGLEFVKEQKEVLRLQLELAAKMDLPVNIHLRDAWEDLFRFMSGPTGTGSSRWASAGLSPSRTPRWPGPWSAFPWKGSCWRQTPLTWHPFRTADSATRAHTCR